MVSAFDACGCEKREKSCTLFSLTPFFGGLTSSRYCMCAKADLSGTISSIMCDIVLKGSLEIAKEVAVW